MIDWSGRTIGNYRVESRLGRGGMGQVVSATHLHLNRTVAIKILHEQLADDPTFRARFQQEARAAAALVHPNVVQVLDFGEQDGLLYLVMELVPDGSLRTLLQQTPGQPLALPLGIELLRQAAEGLAYAHTHRMVHRDVKPDNLLLTRQESGYLLKVTDFGLARLAEGGIHTVSGMTMGTPAYMSPEQCQGHDLDGRSDLYSLGIVLFEVTTGAVPFQTRSLSDAVFKHVYTPPPSPRATRPDLPQFLADIILRCLAKHPDDRFATAGELAAALASIGPSTRHAPPATAMTLPHPAVAPPPTPAPSAPSAPRTTPTSSAPAPYGDTGEVGGTGPPSVPAGATQEPSQQSWLATLLALLLLTGLGALLYFFVLDDEADEGRLAAATATRDTTTATGDDPTATATEELAQVTTTAGVTGPATATATETATASPPATEPPATEPAEIVPAATEPPVAVLDRIIFATGRGQPDPNGYLDIYTMAPDGSDQQPLIVDLGDDWQPDWSPDRTRITWVSKRNGNEDIYVANADGTGQQRLTDDPADDLFPSWSPDGTRISFARNDELFVINLDDGSTTQLTSNTTNDGYLAWSPDGTRIAWMSGLSGNNDIWIMQADGSGAWQLTNHPAYDFSPVWSPDGGSITFISNRNGNFDLFAVASAGGEPVPLTHDPADEIGLAWSPDGTRIAYLRKTGSNGDLIVMSADGASEQRLAGDVFGEDPDITWSPDGRMIAFSRLGDAYIDAWVIYADGTDERRLTSDQYFDGNLDW
jgi:serine/threonine protein kinase/Tol biopolymer transport system component